MQYTNFIGLGVAGNFAGHLEQAGEAADFLHVKTETATQPKAIFPFYVPTDCKNLAESDRFLATFPLSHNTIRFPNDADNLQIEPEVALICEVHYEDNKVIRLTPTHFAAYNDCSIRRPNARKICEKKNWGTASKGLSATQIALDSFSAGCNLDDYRIACFHKRDGQLNEYGIDSPTVGYSYFHQPLLDWIVEKMNHQPDQDPMNNIADLLQSAQFPTHAIISIGATRYTEFGERHFLQIGDTSIVVLYDSKRFNADQIRTMAIREKFDEVGISALVQRII